MIKDKKMLFAAWSCNNKNYFAYQTWNTPLRKIFQHVVSFDPQEQTYKYGKKVMNSNFLKLVKREKPDYILLWLIYDEFYPETLFKVKKLSPKTKVLNFCGDDDAQFYDYSVYNSLFVDYSLITHKEFVKIYKNKAFFSVGTDTNHFKPLNVSKDYDVSFIGTPKTDRVDLVRHLHKNNIKVRVFGAGWEAYPEFKNIYGGFLDQEGYVLTINRTKINLCLSKNYLGVTHVIQKFFEINACRSFVLTEYCQGYADLFVENKELVMFKDKNELLAKVNYYLKNEKGRENIAQRAYKKTVEKYSSEIELRNIFKEIEDDKTIKKIPLLKKKVIDLTENDLRLPTRKIRDLVRRYSYISFHTKNVEHFPYKSLFQVVSLEMFKKDISCCDYYVHSDHFGDLAAIFSKQAFKNLKKEDFNTTIILDQLMVRKSFFLKNLEKFKTLPNKLADMINEKNTSFVTRPLFKVKKFPNLQYGAIKKISWIGFENDIKSLFYQKNIKLPLYIFFILSSYFTSNKFISQYLLERSKVIFKKKFIRPKT